MKIYTDEQVRQAMQDAMIPSIYQMDLWGHLTYIELPSDDELEEISRREILYNDSKRGWWLEGASYILNLIKLQYEKDN